DNGVGTITGTTTDPLSYSAQGSYTIHWSYNDGNGNISTQNQTVIVDDVTAPVANVVSVPNVTGECSASTSAPSANDNCVGTITGTTADATSYSAQGTYTIHWTYSDGHGNASTQNQTVIVDDITAPSISSHANINLSACTPTATWLAPSASDNCSGVTVAQTGGPASPAAVANGGSATVSYTATDIGGNTTSSSFTITRAATLVASNTSGS